MTRQQQKVLIIGGGLGGLVLAQALRSKGVPFEVFERDSDSTSRPQGWAISLHMILDDLLASVPNDMPPIDPVRNTAEVGLPSRGAIYEAKSGKTLTEFPQPGATAMLRADRGKLRVWLETSLSIHWGKRFRRYKEDADGVTAFFDDGTSSRGTILVGADGIQSHVRAQIAGPDGPSPQALPLGAVMGEVELSGAELEHQLTLGPSYYLVATDALFLFVGVKNVAAERSGRYYWAMSWPDPAAAPDDHPLWHLPQAERLQIALERTRDFAEPLRRVLHLTPAEGIADPPRRLRDMEPFALPRGRVTLLGDAIHPMGPFRAEGGNHAMQDALNLARAVAGAGAGAEGIAEALQGYQAEMLKRCKPAVEGSRKAGVDTAGTQPAEYVPWAKRDALKSGGVQA